MKGFMVNSRLRRCRLIARGLEVKLDGVAKTA